MYRMCSYCCKVLHLTVETPINVSVTIFGEPGDLRKGLQLALRTMRFVIQLCVFFNIVFCQL